MLLAIEYEDLLTKQIMINPFISNNDSNYLFRKNYQIISKPPNAPPPSTFSTTKLNLLQSKNPFSPPATLTMSSYATPRSLSNSRANFGSTSRDKPFLGKSRLVEETDGWKRELQLQERGKLQAYGVQGLRYNAYSTYTPNSYDSKPYETARAGSKYQTNNLKDQQKFNDYYESYTKPLDVKPLRASKTNEFYSSKNDTSFQANAKHTKEHFPDEINEDEQSLPARPFHKQRNKYESQGQPNQQSSRHSKLADMFGDMDDRFKQSMQHNSYASYYGGDDLVESKPSRFARDTFQPRGNNYLVESRVDKLHSLDPPTLTIHGKIYYKIEI